MIQKSENFLKEKNIFIKIKEHGFKGYASSYNVEILNHFNPEIQLKDTEYALKSKLIELLTQLKGLKFVTTLVLGFKKVESENKTKYDTFYSSTNSEIIIHKIDIEDVFQSVYATITSNIQKSLGISSGWITDSVTDNTISISEYNPLAESSYIKLSRVRASKEGID